MIGKGGATVNRLQEETGARIVVVAPSVCSRTDLLHRMLAHVAAAPAEAG